MAKERQKPVQPGKPETVDRSIKQYDIERKPSYGVGDDEGTSLGVGRLPDEPEEDTTEENEDGD